MTEDELKEIEGSLAKDALYLEHINGSDIRALIAEVRYWKNKCDQLENALMDDVEN